MRNLSIDVLKIIMAFFVVFLHMHVLKVSHPELSYVLVNGLFRIGVPIFLIITGYYFYYIDTFQKFKKWSIRILLLYLIWSIIYIPLWKEDDHYLLNILFGYHHLWYLIGIFFSGILLYLLKNIDTKMLWISIVCLFICGYSIQFLANSHYFVGEVDVVLNIFPTYRNFLFVCFPFLGIGFLIKKLNLDATAKPSLWLVLVSICLVIFEAFLNYKVLNLNKKESVDMLLSLMWACPLLFLYCKNITVKTDSRMLANISTAIYLIHPLLMNFIFKFPYPYIRSFENEIFIITLLSVSCILVYINKRIKYLL
ncbi:hypothetical protein D1632_13595 [Chryseobacterium nematophagum]|uniref:Acyltransferase 3 domain-containing protein n=1 Tax=Chryseobacterium nematophagum TaxID=2305228 RepID=A0A3M7L7P6_9FLAO|nr:acyltransferase family protein [Chryseobacterium nematophagum]RMZ58627.1 hypothetical protein D1632_13595 [Chryseobacterium nematophagum]